jgi:hypothetical protein
MSSKSAGSFSSAVAEHAWGRTDASWAVRIPSVQAVAAVRAAKRGAEVVYVGSTDRLEALRFDPWLSQAISAALRWRMLPMAEIATAALKAMPELLRFPLAEPSVLGVMCLPAGVVDHILPERGEPRACLLLDGVDTSKPGSSIALEGIQSLCHRTRVEFHAFL